MATARKTRARKKATARAPASPPGLRIEDAPPEILQALKAQGVKVPAPRTQKFSAEQERQHALKILAAIADLTKAQRERVLRRAMKFNAI